MASPRAHCAAQAGDIVSYKIVKAEERRYGRLVSARSIVDRCTCLRPSCTGAGAPSHSRAPHISGCYCCEIIGAAPARILHPVPRNSLRLPTPRLQFLGQAGECRQAWNTAFGSTTRAG